MSSKDVHDALREWPGSSWNNVVKLTETEIKVLRLAKDGLSSQEIADSLCNSRRTIEFHLANVYHKLDVKNRTAAIKVAWAKGLIPEEG